MSKLKSKVKSPVLFEFENQVGSYKMWYENKPNDTCEWPSQLNYVACVHLPSRKRVELIDVSPKLK